jgi:hypothetical protein
MPVGTVRGRFELDAPALRTLRDLERQGIRTERQMKKLADEMDRVGGREDAERLRDWSRAQADMRRSTERDHLAIRREWSATTRHVRLEVRRQIREIRTLEASLDRLATRRVSARVNVSGVAGAETRLGALNSQLDRADRGRIRLGAPRAPNVSSRPGGAGGGRGGVGGATRNGLLDFGNVGLRPRNAAIAAGLAYAPQLLGAGTALAGSAGMAALGAGAIGTAGAGALGTGVAGTMLVGRQTVTQLGNAQKATQKYTDAVADFGRASTQAKNAKRELDQVMATAPRGTRQLLRDVKSLRTEWDHLTRPGQRSFMQLLVGGVDAGRRLARRGGAAAANRVTRATSREGRNLANFAAGSFGRRLVGQGSRMFNENLGDARRSVENVAMAGLNVMQGARPFLREATDFVQRWTSGWRRSTSDIGSVRDKIREMVGHLRSWWRLTRTAGGLAGALLGAGAGSGRNMVDDATRQLRIWEQWVRNNPRRVQEFFRTAVDSTEKLAGGLVAIGKALWNISTALRPVLDRFGQLVSLAGAAGLLTPGAGAAAYGAFRGITGRGGRGGGGGGGGILPIIGGGGGAGGGAGAGFRGAAAGLRGTGRLGVGTYQVARSVGYNPALAAGAGAIAMGGRAGSAGLRVAGMAARGAGKAFLPIGLGMAALDFAGTPGTFGQRTQAALSGATLGLIPRPILGTARDDRGISAARSFLDRHVNQDSTITGQRTAMSQIQRQIRENQRKAHATTVIHGGGTEGGGGGYTRRASTVTAGEQRELAAQNKELRSALAERRGIYRDYIRERDRTLNQQSRQRAGNIWQDLLMGNRRISGQRGAQAGTHRTVSAALDEMRNLRKAGKRELGQAALDWAKEAAHKNPRLRKEYERLVAGVEKQFDQLHTKVKVVNGQILDGSEAQWSATADAISSAARRGVDQTSKEFQRLKRLAIEQLTLMGFSRKEASDLFRYQTKGGTTAARARRAAADPARFKNAPAFKGGGGDRNTGDGPGQVGAGSAPAGSGGAAVGGLMGAKPGLGVYAQEGSRFGLKVTSGARPGAVTVSGNTSYHASGNAIDISGPPGQMLAFARYMSQTYGPQLEELIHTPAGNAQIKNGRPYVYSGAVAAQHFDHVHVADTQPPGSAANGAIVAGAGGVGGGAISLNARQITAGGIVGAAGTRAAGGVAIGIQQAVNAAIGGGAGAVATGGGIQSAGGKYDKAALAALWQQANPGVGDPNLMAAIALAESGGNPSAHNPSGASGLWQILGVPFPGNPMDPFTNARMAGAKFKTQGLRAWEAYTNGMYRRFAGDGLGRSTSSKPSGSARIRRSRGTRMGRFTSGGVNVSFAGATFHVRNQSDIDAIANAVGAKMLAALKGGDAVTDAALT